MSKYGVISGPYFPVFGPEITPYLDTFHTAMSFLVDSLQYSFKHFSLCYKDIYNKVALQKYYKGNQKVEF